jgi:F-type H+-transporting ATPase subunit epsilon
VADPMQVELVSPERILYSGESDMVVCRTLDGEVAFMADHAPFVGVLSIGEVRIYRGGSVEERAAVHGGFVEVSDNRVTLLSDVAELASQIDVERARKRLQEFERRTIEMDDAECEAGLRRQHVRIAVADAH